MSREGLNSKRFTSIFLGLLSAVLFTIGIQAQDTGGEEEEEEEEEELEFVEGEPIEEIVVTGSRIVRVELEGSSPVQVFSREDIQRSGETSLGELLREMPSVAGGAQTTQINNGGDGTNRVSIRGLGSSRTLVIMNGRRLPPSGTGLSSSNLTSAVDLNTIPVSMVERIEVFKDGASAVYGSEAVGGVVNIITRRDYDGVEFNYQWGLANRGDGSRNGLDFTFGESGEESSFVVFGSYVEEGLICACEREWADRPLALFLGDQILLGSSAPPWGRYRFVDVDGNPQDLTRGPEYGDFRRFSFFGGDSYNFAPSNHQRQPSRRWSAVLQADRMIDDLPGLGEVRMFFNLSYLNRDGNQRLAEVPLAPLAFFGFNAPYSPDNFYNPFGVNIGDWRRRMVEGGSRFEDVLTETKQVMVGLEGSYQDWNWDTHFSFGETASEGHFGHVYNLQRVANATGPSLKDSNGNWVLDVDGNPRCANDTANCVPLNVFGENSVTKEMIDYVTFVDNQASLQDQKNIVINLVNSNIVDMQAGPLGLAFGFEWREERGSDIPDSQVNALGSAATGTPRKPTSGGFSVSEFYGEVAVPLAGGGSMMELVEVNAAARHSQYDPFGSTTNGKLGLKWRVNGQFMGRASVSQAFRAPSTSDLYGGSGFSFPALTDPCAKDATEFCQADGVPASGFQPISTQIRTTVGGNINAQPETAIILTIGAVYEPAMFGGMSLTVDRWSIDLTNSLSTLGASYILGQCHSKGTFCDLIDRIGSGPNAGNPINVVNTVTNVGGTKTSGFDIGMMYRGYELPWGTMDVRWEATKLGSYEVTQADGTTEEFSGRFDDNEVGYFTVWRSNLDIVYIRGDLEVSWQARHIGEAEEEAYDWGTGIGVKRVLEGRLYQDMQFSYGIPQHSLILSGGVDNLLDADPPLSLSAFNDNTDVRTFDTVGRYFYFRVKFTPQ